MIYSSLQRGGKGGRYYQNLTLEEERQLLQAFLAQSENGGILAVSRVKAADEQALGRKVPKFNRELVASTAGFDWIIN
jgi:hypothetical protein